MMCRIEFHGQYDRWGLLFADEDPGRASYNTVPDSNPDSQ